MWCGGREGGGASAPVFVAAPCKNGPADAMAETAPFSPGFFQHAIESFQGKRTAWRTERATENTCCIEIGGNELSVPREAHRFVKELRVAQHRAGVLLPLWFVCG